MYLLKTAGKNLRNFTGINKLQLLFDVGYIYLTFSQSTEMISWKDAKICNSSCTLFDLTNERLVIDIIVRSFKLEATFDCKICFSFLYFHFLHIMYMLMYIIRLNFMSRSLSGNQAVFIFTTYLIHPILMYHYWLFNPFLLTTTFLSKFCFYLIEGCKFIFVIFNSWNICQNYHYCLPTL